MPCDPVQGPDLGIRKKGEGTGNTREGEETRLGEGGSVAAVGMTKHAGESVNE